MSILLHTKNKPCCGFEPNNPAKEHMCTTNHTVKACEASQVFISIKYGNCKPLTLPWGFVVALHCCPRSDTLDLKLILGIIFSLYETLAIIVFKDLFLVSYMYGYFQYTDIIILYLDTWNFPLCSSLVCSNKNIKNLGGTHNPKS